MQRRFLLIFAKIMAYDFNVVTSIQAEEELRGIFEYIAFELFVSCTADATLKNSSASIQSNKQFHIPHKAVTPLEINRFFYIQT